MRLTVPLLALAAPAAVARVHWSLAEDLYAFPKYRVAFLNGQPVLSTTAERWLQHGLGGGEREFLNQPVDGAHPAAASARKEIEGADGAARDVLEPAREPRYKLQRMNLSGKNPYVCLIPPPVESHTQPVEEPQLEANPAQTWSLLQPLSGSCLYHRQGWFTYAYCHNNQVRQFREMAHSHPHHAGYVPEEDPEWEAFTLGQAATIPGEGRDLTHAQQAALTSNIEIAHTAGHHYLVQTWGDGTHCDKTGKPREIEVQFHCSTSMTDTILFVKETKTCHYVMVIHTPRLCGERGFKTRLEQRDEAVIRCREVLADEAALAAAAADTSLPETPYPEQHRARNPILGAPPTLPTGSAGGAEDDDAADGRRREGPAKAEYAILQAIEALLAAGGASGSNHREAEAGSLLAQEQQQQEQGTGVDGSSSGVHVAPGKDGEVIIEFFDAADGDDAGRLEEMLDSLFAESTGTFQRLQDALRAAGHDVEGVKKPQQPQGGNAADETDGAESRKQKRHEDAQKMQQRDEL